MKTTTTNLFATATKVKETTKKTDKKVILSPLLGNKVQRYAELKQTIDSATGELKMIEGETDLQVGKPYFTDEEDNRVIYDLDKHQWKYEDSGKLIDDEDFFPIDVNPYG